MSVALETQIEKNMNDSDGSFMISKDSRTSPTNISVDDLSDKTKSLGDHRTSTTGSSTKKREIFEEETSKGISVKVSPEGARVSQDIADWAVRHAAQLEAEGRHDLANDARDTADAIVSSGYAEAPVSPKSLAGSANPDHPVAFITHNGRRIPITDPRYLQQHPAQEASRNDLVSFAPGTTFARRGDVGVHQGSRVGSDGKVLHKVRLLSGDPKYHGQEYSVPESMVNGVHRPHDPNAEIGWAHPDVTEGRQVSSKIPQKVGTSRSGRSSSGVTSSLPKDVPDLEAFYSEWLKSLPTTSRTAISKYCRSNACKVANRFFDRHPSRADFDELWTSPTPEDRAAAVMIRDLDRTFDLAEGLPEDIVVSRRTKGIELERFGEDIPLGRGVPCPGYTSTSYYGKPPKRDSKHVYEISVPKGTKGIWVGSLALMQQEREFILPRGGVLLIHEHHFDEESGEHHYKASWLGIDEDLANWSKKSRFKSIESSTSFDPSDDGWSFGEPFVLNKESLDRIVPNFSWSSLYEGSDSEKVASSDIEKDNVSVPTSSGPSSTTTTPQSSSQVPTNGLVLGPDGTQGVWKTIHGHKVFVHWGQQGKGNTQVWHPSMPGPVPSPLAAQGTQPVPQPKKKQIHELVPGDIVTVSGKKTWAGYTAEVLSPASGGTISVKVLEKNGKKDGYYGQIYKKLSTQGVEHYTPGDQLKSHPESWVGHAQLKEIPKDEVKVDDIITSDFDALKGLHAIVDSVNSNAGTVQCTFYDQDGSVKFKNVTLAPFGISHVYELHHAGSPASQNSPSSIVGSKLQNTSQSTPATKPVEPKTSDGEPIVAGTAYYYSIGGSSFPFTVHSILPNGQISGTVYNQPKNHGTDVTVDPSTLSWLKPKTSTQPQSTSTGQVGQTSDGHSIDVGDDIWFWNKHKNEWTQGTALQGDKASGKVSLELKDGSKLEIPQHYLFSKEYADTHNQPLFYGSNKPIHQPKPQANPSTQTVSPPQANLGPPDPSMSDDVYLQAWVGALKSQPTNPSILSSASKLHHYPQDLANSWKSSLTPEEKAAAKSYTGSSYLHWNDLLRKKSPLGSYAASIDHLRSALAKAPVIPHELILERGMGSELTKQLVLQLKKKGLTDMKGQYLHDLGFMSTSLGSPFGGSNRLHIRCAAGTKLAPVFAVSSHTHENEIVFPDSSVLEIKDVWKDGQQIHWEVEYRPDLQGNPPVDTANKKRKVEKLVKSRPSRSRRDYDKWVAQEGEMTLLSEDDISERSKSRPHGKKSGETGSKKSDE